MRVLSCHILFVRVLSTVCHVLLLLSSTMLCVGLVDIIISYVMHCCNNVTAHQGGKELQVFMVATILITSVAGKILCNNCILH